jgi:hypothetical protein
MSDPRENLSEAEAMRLWQKAAQLQAEAARLAEARAADEAGIALEGAPARRDEEGYALMHVRAAALEAGIGEEFVDAALAEVRADRALTERSGGKRYPVSSLLLGNPPKVVTASRTIRATPEQVLTAMEEIFPNEPYVLLLRDRMGDPARGGTLVFDIQGVGFSTAGSPGFKGDASYADLREVYATLAPLPGSPARTEVTIRSPVSWALTLNAGISVVVSAMGGGLGLGVSVALVSLLGIAAPVVPALLVAGGATLSATATLGGFRALYRYGQRRGARSLETLLGALAAKCEGGWGIAPKNG